MKVRDTAERETPARSATSLSVTAMTRPLRPYIGQVYRCAGGKEPQECGRMEINSGVSGWKADMAQNAGRHACLMGREW